MKPISPARQARRQQRKDLQRGLQSKRASKEPFFVFGERHDEPLRDAIRFMAQGAADHLSCKDLSTEHSFLLELDHRGEKLTMAIAYGDDLTCALHNLIVCATDSRGKNPASRERLCDDFVQATLGRDRSRDDRDLSDVLDEMADFAVRDLSMTSTTNRNLVVLSSSGHAGHAVQMVVSYRTDPNFNLLRWAATTIQKQINDMLILSTGVHHEPA